LEGTLSLKRLYEDVPSDARHYFQAMDRVALEYLLRNTTSHYDPIFTPLFTSLFTSIGFSAGAAAIAGQIATAIVTTGISIGLNMLLAPKPPKPEDGKVPMTQAIPHRIWAVGRTRLAGARMLWEAVGPNLYCVNALVAHRVKSINRYFLHDDEVEITGYGHPGGVSPVGNRYAAGGVRLWSRTGANPETAYTELIADLGVQTGNPSQTIWTTSHRGDGQTSLAMIAQNASAKDQQRSYPYGPPEPSVEGDWAYCWDFRDPLQDPDDDTTWAWTQNCAVIIAWHLCFSEFGYGADYRKAILPVLELWQEEADVCDELVPLNGGGTERRYECNGWDTTENGPKAALVAMLSACDGHLVVRGDGARILTVGKFRESRCVTLTDADILGHRVDYDVLFEDEINRLIPTFNYPETGYSSTDTDYFEDTAAQLTAGRVLAEQVDYQWVHQWRQARRLAYREWKRIRQKVRGQLDVRHSGINAVYARWVRLSTPVRMPRLNGKIVENRRSILAVTKGGYTMDVVRHPDDIDVWTPDTDEGQQPPVPQNPDPGELVVPVVNLVQAKPSGSSVYIRVVIIDPEDDGLTPVVRYRVADTGSGSPGAWIEQEFPDFTASGGYISLNTNTVPSDEDIEIEVAFKVSSGLYSDWSITADVNSTIDPDPPGVVTGVSATGGVGQATFNWTAPASDNYAGVRLYWNTSNTSTGATPVSPPEYGAPSAADSRVVTGISAGTRYGFIRSINASGVQSSAVATGSFVVT
jgi:hypothetical protein